MFRVQRLVLKSEHRIPLASMTRMPWPKKQTIIQPGCVRGANSKHLLQLWPNPNLHPSRCSAAGSLHGAVVWGEFPMFIITPSVDRATDHLRRNSRTKPEGTVTLARPMVSSTFRTMPVGGSRSAFSSAGHTIPVHWPCNIGATGMYVPVLASPVSRRTRSASRTA